MNEYIWFELWIVVAGIRHSVLVTLVFCELFKSSVKDSKAFTPVSDGVNNVGGRIGLDLDFPIVFWAIQMALAILKTINLINKFIYWH